jgi:hypothetical protein
MVYKKIILPPFLDIRCIFFVKIPEYKVYGRIMRFFENNLGVNLTRKDKKPRFPYFSSILTAITYMYERLKVSKFALLARALILVQENYTSYIKEWRKYHTQCIGIKKCI